MLKSLFSQLLRKRPELALYQEGLTAALAYETAGRLGEAEALYRRLDGEGQRADIMRLLGNNLQRQGKMLEALVPLQQAAALEPASPDAHFLLASVLYALGRSADAACSYERALQLRPNFVEAMTNLGTVLKDAGRPEEAERWYRSALGLRPQHWQTANNLARVLHEEGRIEEAIGYYRSAFEANPDFVDAHSNYIYWLNFDPAYEPEQIFDAHVEWARRHAEPLPRLATRHASEPLPERRLRVGYVSPNFKEHAVACFFESTLACHDPSEVDVHCYSDVEAPDEGTERLRTLAHHWHETAGLADEQFARKVMKDGIDVLVDLSGHTQGNRLLAFARKPAPVQITWNGYANTTGISAMDYRITDAITDPPGVTDRLHTEHLIRMPHVYMVFTRPFQSPQVNRPPVESAGHLTFGSFNAVTKITSQVAALWSRVLLALPGARLLIATVPSAAARERLCGIFEGYGIRDDRIEFYPRLPKDEFLRLHHRADIALDPFPFNGTTTTCHSLWMGLPVVTLAGTTHVARVGASMLTNIGLSEFVAKSEEQYADIALRLALDPPRLAELRSNLRERMLASPLMDAVSFAHALESRYREAWRIWCAGASTSK